MLDLKKIKKDREFYEKRLAIRHMGLDLGGLLQADADRVALQKEAEELQRAANEASARIGQLAKEGQDITRAKADAKAMAEKVKEKEAELRDLEEKVRDIALGFPNIPAESVPEGETEDDNVEVRTWGEPSRFDFTPKNHLEIGEGLGILDLERATKITGARFPLYRGMGARLERALANFMLDTHADKGYEEVITPFMVNSKTMTGTGQLPKFAEDLFAIEGMDYWLIPTAEVPVTNIYADEILNSADLPKKFCAFTPCFRKEAGSYGKIATGLIRQHQFNKVELVKLSLPEKSDEELEDLTADAEEILQKLELPYRVVQLCSGDLGFSAAKTYDLEVWLPSQDRYVEISSCSNFTDFQARRAGIRFKRDGTGKPEYLHTLNGSGLAVGRTLVALLENRQEKDGSVTIPPALQKYMGGVEKIGK